MLTKESEKRFFAYKEKLHHMKKRDEMVEEYRRIFQEEPGAKQPMWGMAERLVRNYQQVEEKSTPTELEEMHKKFLDIQDQYNKMNQKYSDEHIKAGRLEEDNDKLRQRMDMLVDTLCGIMNMQGHFQGLRFR